MMLTEARNVLIAYSLFMDLWHRGVRYIITDDASWYRLAAGWTRLRHGVVHGLHRYLECFIETIKAYA